jgi:hypothetical protein
MLGYSDLLLCTPLNRNSRNWRRESDSMPGVPSRWWPACSALPNKARPPWLPWISIPCCAPPSNSRNLSGRLSRSKCAPSIPGSCCSFRGDSNQLLQVCVQIINDALHAVGHQRQPDSNHRRRAQKTASPSSTFPMPPAAKQPNSRKPSEGEDQTLSGLGLSACQGILQQHHGRIRLAAGPERRNHNPHRIPVITPAPEKSSDPGVPVMWQPQPFA